MKKSLFVALAVGLSNLAHAATQSWQPNPVDLYDLDHHYAYAWRIAGISIPSGDTITAASLFFKDIRNWDSNPNQLFIHLLDSALGVGSGVSSFIDSPSDATTFADNFAGALYTSTSNTLISHPSEPSNTYLTTFVNLPTTAQDITYNFTAAQLTALTSYIANGANIAFGIDPDCHYFNNGITFTLTTTPTAIPEPGSVLLLGSVAAGLLYRLRKRRSA